MRGRGKTKIFTSSSLPPALWLLTRDQPPSSERSYNKDYRFERRVKRHLEKEGLIFSNDEKALV